MNVMYKTKVSQMTLAKLSKHKLIHTNLYRNSTLIHTYKYINQLT